MSALDVLRQIKQARRGKSGGPAKKAIQWGSFEQINEIGLENFSRRELRNHLEARDLDSEGTRLELMERLRISLAEEQLNKFAYTETMDTEFLLIADAEQRGSVYVCGSNSKGELGVGDLVPRPNFCVVPLLRGVGVVFVQASTDMCYAITNENDVYVWGGGGVGRNGIQANSNPKAKKLIDGQPVNNFLEPQLIMDLAGEECSVLAIGLSHGLAVGRGGDVFCWGDNSTGQLGLGDFVSHPTICINNSFPAIALVGAGANHSVGLTRDGQVYCWGHAANGRLGIGATERMGVSENERQYFPLPQCIPAIESIKKISCGADHTLGFGASGVWSWGCGSGGKLGHGDTLDRNNPCLIPKLRGKFVLQLSAGTWHSMALVCFPPLIGGGFIYSWGSGYHGQLAQKSRVICLEPELIEYFLQTHLTLRFIAAGSHHCAAITKDGELYTWGSNANGCLGRKLDEKNVTFTPYPGHVGGFNAIVSKIGRGQPRHVTCGKEFTVVCTFPYTGPSLEIASKLMEEAKLREQEDKLVGGP